VIFWVQLTELEQNIFLQQLREIYCSSQTTNDQPHFSIQLPNTTYSHRSHFNN